MVGNRFLIVCVAFCLLLSGAWAQENCITFITSPKCQSPETNAGNQCITFQSGLRDLQAYLVESTRGTYAPCDFVELHLPAGKHALSSSIFISASGSMLKALHVYGSGEAYTSIECSQDVDMQEELFSIRMQNIEVVSVEDVTVYGCSRPLSFENVQNLTVSRSTFRFFTAGALDIYNCLHVRVLDSIFAYNRAELLIRTSPFRGNAGGIAVGLYHSPFNESTATIHLENSTFVQNRAEPVGMDIVSSSDLIARGIFAGRGGGVGMYVQQDSTVSTTIQNCRFERNYATTFGGGMYIILDGGLMNHSLVITSSEFADNESGDGGGGLNVGFLYFRYTVPSVSIMKCYFANNQATYGGGAYVYPGIGVGNGYTVVFKNCTFVRNRAEKYGAALGLISLDFFDPQTEYAPYNIHNCTFMANRGSSGGIVAISYAPVLMLGQENFINNTGSSLRIIGTRLTVDGQLWFTDNNAENMDGGALYVTSYGQVALTKGATLHFERNLGNLGSSIVVESQTVVNGFTKILYNPLCFLLYGPDYTVPPQEWEGVSINFSGNKAIIGSAVYINQLDLCSWYFLKPPHFNRSGVLRWPFVNLNNDNRDLGHRNDDSSRYIQTPSVSLKVKGEGISASPGEEVHVDVDTIDELGLSTSGVIRLEDLYEAQGNQFTNETLTVGYIPATYSFTPNLVAIEPRLGTTATMFTVNSKNFTISTNVSVSIYNDYARQSGGVVENISFTAHVCPPGNVLTSQAEGGEEKVCTCNTVNNPFLLDCDTDRETLILRPHNWCSFTTNPDGTLALQTHLCPDGYCNLLHNTSFGEMTYSSIFVYTNPDLQCQCNRSGILCGTCPEGFGVSALLERCVTCNDAYSIFIPLLMILDIAVCIMILLVSKPLPDWVYPCLFYVQIAYHITDSFPITFDAVQRLQHYVSSALALYFPYDFCLYEDMTALVSHLLRYLPLFTVIPTTIIVEVVRHKVFRPVAWYGVWNLILLMYAQIVHTSSSILFCTFVSIESESSARWYIDGSVGCFTGGHIPLSLLAMVILLFAAVLVPLTALFSANLLRKPRFLECTVQPLRAIYKPQFYWWSSVELARRFVAIIITVYLPENTEAHSYVIMSFAALYLFIQPYKFWVANIMEAILAVDVLVMLLIVSTDYIGDHLVQRDLTKLSVNEDNCPDPISGVTKLTVVLTPLYYLPLLILVSGVITVSSRSLILHSWKFCKKSKHSEAVDYAELSSTQMKVAPGFQMTSVGLD